MTCLICGSGTRFYFSKEYTEPPFDRFMRDIGPVHYHICETCGFVISKTHAALSDERWAQLNLDVHSYLEGPDNENKELGNQPPYIDQASMLAVLGKNGIVDTSKMLDYAAGYGTLSSILDRYFSIQLAIHDRFVRSGNDARYVEEPILAGYSTVINSAMLEHIRTRDDLEALNKLCAPDGALVLHTVVCERIPPDPNWFYIRPPVHTAFHTNKSMDILMKQWGFRSSVYCPKAKSWTLLKICDQDVEDAVRRINLELQEHYLYYKEGFVDYWKGF